MALKPDETNPPVTRSQGRQSAQQVGGSRSIVDQQQLPIFISLRKHRVHSLAQPRNRSVEYGRQYADERLRKESARLMAHRGQLLGTRSVQSSSEGLSAADEIFSKLFWRASPEADKARARFGQSCSREICAGFFSARLATSVRAGIVSA